MAWRLARSLETLRAQINALSPNRSKVSDGTIGDTAHSKRKSEHNPDSKGRVRALDLTHDPAHGVEGRKLAEALLASRDPRIEGLAVEVRQIRAEIRQGREAAAEEAARALQLFQQADSEVGRHREEMQEHREELRRHGDRLPRR